MRGKRWTPIVMVVHLIKRSAKKKRDFLPGVVFILDNKPLMGDPYPPIQAKGKMERPYGWLQDRLVRTCARENITDIRQAQRVLSQEVYRYNNRQVHSTTQEIPYVRLQRALDDKKSLFREFKIKPPYQSIKDIFCLRLNRTINPYRKISLNNLQLKLNGAVPGNTVNLRIYPMSRGIAEVRFWCNDEFIDVQRVKNSDIRTVHF